MRSPSREQKEKVPAEDHTLLHSEKTSVRSAAAENKIIFTMLCLQWMGVKFAGRLRKNEWFCGEGTYETAK